jgi:hypothetical protein
MKLKPRIRFRSLTDQVGRRVESTLSQLNTDAAQDDALAAGRTAASPRRPEPQARRPMRPITDDVGAALMKRLSVPEVCDSAADQAPKDAEKPKVVPAQPDDE